MVQHPAFAVVFQLEYVFSSPVAADGSVSIAPGLGFPLRAGRERQQGSKGGACLKSLFLCRPPVPGRSGLVLLGTVVCSSVRFMSRDSIDS